MGLVSLESLGSNKLLLRLGHRFAIGEDAILSKPVGLGGRIVGWVTGGREGGVNRPIWLALIGAEFL